MASNDLISIIIPVKNEKNRIRTIIDGLYRQTYRPIEVIFVDGGSTDGTVEEIMNVIKEHSSDDFKVRLLRESDFGPIRSLPNARNIGVLNANGKYIAFFDADFDLRSDSDAVSKIVQAFKNGANHVAVKYVPNMHTWIEKHLAFDDIVNFVYYYNSDKPIHLLCAFKRELFNEVRLNPTLGFGEDMEFLGRLSKHIKHNTVVIDTGIRRCYLHTLSDVKRQQLWYGRTAMRYYRVAGINPLTTIVRSNAVLGLVLLTIITAPLIGLSSIIFLFSAFALIYVRWLRKDIKILRLIKFSVLDRFAWYLFREVIRRLFFDIGFIRSILHKQIEIGR
jgi:glycosyltransferase involved in cell wall biosynthesis